MGNKVMQEVEIRTGVWYKDRLIKLTFPNSWEVTTYWPDTPPPLTDEDILERINIPVGQPPLKELAKGKKNPIIVIDDLARPTPVFRIMPFLLKEFNLAGIHSKDIRILVATGTHGDQDQRALANKIGKETAESCQIITHHDKRNTRFIGNTSFGTPVYVNREGLNSDLMIGIGGIYPNQTAGFGGGAKLALGILGRKSIMHLHFRHAGADGTYNTDNTFRKDLTEIARMISLNTIYALHINAQLDLVNLTCGDHFIYFPQSVEFSREKYIAPLPGDADVVIANGYPSDISYTFMQKGIKPIRCASRGATKIMIGSNPQGIGRHGFFQQGGSQRLKDYKFLYHKLSVMEPKEIISKILKKIFLRGQRPTMSERKSPGMSEEISQLWVFRPQTDASTPIPQLPGVQVVEAWDDILKVIEQEHSSKKNIKVRIYPCAPLQYLDAQAIQGEVEEIHK